MKRYFLVLSLLIGSSLSACSSQPFEVWRSPAKESATAAAPAPTPDAAFQSARQLAWEAAVLVSQPPHPVETWQAARVKWRQAIRLLESIPEQAAIAPAAKQKLEDYRAKHREIEQRLSEEETAVDHFETAQTLAWQAAVTVQSPPHPLRVWQRAENRWVRAIRLMARVPPRTTVAAIAQEKLKVYRQNQTAIRQQIATDQQVLATLQNFSMAASQLNTLQTKAVVGQTSTSMGLAYDEYAVLVRSLRDSLTKIESLPRVKAHPIYSDLRRTIADYEFALAIWQSYLKHKEANALWLHDDEFYNQLLPLSLIDSDRLLKNYSNIKIYRGIKEAKIPLKFTLWEIWDKAKQDLHQTQKKIPTS